MKEKQSEKSELDLPSLHKVKCPQCGGEINRILYSEVNYLRGNAVFIVECWSGDLNKPSDYHVFRVTIPIKIDVNMDSEDQ